MIVIFYYYPWARRRVVESGREGRIQGSDADGSRRVGWKSRAAAHRSERGWRRKKKRNRRGNDGAGGIEKQFTRKSALDLSDPRRLFLIGVSRSVVDGFCVLSRALFLRRADARWNRGTNWRSSRFQKYRRGLRDACAWSRSEEEGAAGTDAVPRQLASNLRPRGNTRER